MCSVPDLLLKRTAMFFTNFSLKVDFGCGAILYMPQLQYQPRKEGRGGKTSATAIRFARQRNAQFPSWVEPRALYAVPPFKPSIPHLYKAAYQEHLQAVPAPSRQSATCTHSGRQGYAIQPVQRGSSQLCMVCQPTSVKLGSALKKVGEMLRTGSPLHAAPQGTDGLSPCNKWVIALFALNS